MKIKIKSVLKTLSLFCIKYVPMVPISYKVLENFVYRGLGASFLGAVICCVTCTVYLCILVTISLAIQYAMDTEQGSQQKAVTADHGNRIEDVMEAIRHEEYEYLAYFNFDGEKIAEGTFLLPDMCNVTAEDWTRVYLYKKEVIGVHNHPGEDNMAFSDGDFESFLSQKHYRRSIVVTKDYDYVLEKVGDSKTPLRGEARTYVRKMDIRYAWLSVFSARLWSIVVARRAAKRFGLIFSVERVSQVSVKNFLLRFGIIMFLTTTISRFIRTVKTHTSQI